MQTRYTERELVEYIANKRLQLSQAASLWMKAEISKGIKLAESELAKLQK